MQSLKILYSAYACEPGRGSEPGVGWHWAVETARLGHEVWVITRANNRGVIERAMDALARLVVEGDIERAPCALDSPAYANIRTPINAAVFHNLQGISADELKQSYASYLGPDKPISTICSLFSKSCGLLL